MAWSELELDYMNSHQNIFDIGNMGEILNSLDQAYRSNELTRKSANKIAFFTALAMDRSSIVLVVENRGNSRSSRRADVGHKIMRIHYGIKVDGLKPSGDDKMPVIHISQRVKSPKVAVDMYEFTYFRGTLSPEHLKQLMYNPLVTYNRSSFGKNFGDLVVEIINKVDWDSIDKE